ncbi:MAG: hypothetical protein OEV44_00125 [Spirochaetota bacterium]|nr:hypothetical protein [Spirochaetota bacterium]
MKKQAEFTNTEFGILYAIVNEFGNDKKPELMKEIKSLMRYDRMIMKGRILGALKGIL